MTPERWQQINDLYHLARERDAAGRHAFLAEACGDDAGLREEVASLLSADEQSGAVIDASMGGELRAACERPSLIGARLASYEVLSLIGSGGMGDVYRARDLTLGREVALKILDRAVTGDPLQIRRFEEEARLACVLNHPNIVTIYGVGQEGDFSFIAMEVVDGQTLRAVFESRRLPAAEMLRLAVQLVDALTAAHEKGITHRDLKPENIMLTSGGIVKVLDFGLARRRLLSALGDAPAAARLTLTLEGTVLGTVGYMSPEQAAGESSGPASDQFSLGAVLYEGFTGRRAFKRRTAVETLSAIIQEPPDPIAFDEVPAGIKGILERCLAKDPGARFPSSRDLLGALRELEASRLAAMRVREPVPANANAGVTRRRALWLSGAAVAAAAAAVAGRRWYGSGAPNQRSLAVLPFVNTGQADDMEYLAEGLTDSLIQRVSALSSLRVIARSTVLNFKGQSRTPLDIGRSLGVDFVLTGTVVRSQGRLSISAELVDVATGAQVWGNRYDRAENDLLAVQDELATAIVDEGIRVRLSGEERRRLVLHPTDNPKAYELYMRGRHLILRHTEDGYTTARQYLQEAVTLDDRFALGYSALSSTFGLMAVDGYQRPTEAWPEADRTIRRAVALDPDLPDYHAQVAAEAFFFNWDWARAEREWTLATAASGGGPDPELLEPYALERWALGRPDDALDVVRRIRKMDPVSPAFVVLEADYLLHAGQSDQAIRTYEQVIRDEPEDPRAYFGLAEAHRGARRFNEAIDALHRGRMRIGDDSFESLFASARDEEGLRRVERAIARQQLDELAARAPKGYVSPLDVARAHAQLGNKDEAFRHFEAAFADRSPGLVFLNVDRAWDGLRDDARFRDAVRRVGLP